MNNSLYPENKFVQWVSCMVYPVLVLGFTLFFGSLVARFWSYYDLGVGTAANRGALFYIYLPAMFLVLTLALTGTGLILNKLGYPNWLNFLIIVTVAVSTVALGIIIEVWQSTSVYPEIDLLEFLRSYFSGSLW